MSPTQPTLKLEGGKLFTVKIRMHIGTRRPNSHNNETEEFEPLVSIEMGKVDGGELLSLANTPPGQIHVRLYDRNAKEIRTNQYNNPLIAADAGAVLRAIKADMSGRQELESNPRYRLASATLEMLTRFLPDAEVVFEAYLAMRPRQ